MSFTIRLQAEENKNGRERPVIGRVRRGIAREIVEGLYRVHRSANGKTARLMSVPLLKPHVSLRWADGQVVAESCISGSMAAAFQNLMAETFPGEWPRSCDPA